MLAAVTQICSGSNIAANAAMCRSVIARAATAGAKLVFLPEASDFIVNSTDVPSLLEPLDKSVFVRELRAQALASRVWVSVGIHELPLPGEDDRGSRGFNTQLLLSDTGDLVARYRKLHLFDVDIKGGLTILESNTTVPGTEKPPVAQSPVGALGLLTCYDIRFPEISSQLRRRGAEILTYPSAFTVKTGAAHWHLLLRARAVENQCYVFAAAQAGFHSSTRQSYGHALAVDPWGSVLAELPDSPIAPGDEHAGKFALVDVDLSWLSQIRRDMPLWDQRRTDMYPVV